MDVNYTHTVTPEHSETYRPPRSVRRLLENCLSDGILEAPHRAPKYPDTIIIKPEYLPLIISPKSHSHHGHNNSSKYVPVNEPRHRPVSQHKERHYRSSKSRAESNPSRPIIDRSTQVSGHARSVQAYYPEERIERYKHTEKNHVRDTVTKIPRSPPLYNKQTQYSISRDHENKKSATTSISLSFIEKQEYKKQEEHILQSVKLPSIPTKSAIDDTTNNKTQNTSINMSCNNIDKTFEDVAYSEIYITHQTKNESSKSIHCEKEFKEKYENENEPFQVLQTKPIVSYKDSNENTKISQLHSSPSLSSSQQKQQQQQTNSIIDKIISNGNVSQESISDGLKPPEELLEISSTLSGPNNIPVRTLSLAKSITSSPGNSQSTNSNIGNALKIRTGDILHVSPFIKPPQTPTKTNNTVDNINLINGASAANLDDASQPKTSKALIDTLSVINSLPNEDVINMDALDYNDYNDDNNNELEEIVDPRTAAKNILEQLDHEEKNQKSHPPYSNILNNIDNNHSNNNLQNISPTQRTVYDITVRKLTKSASPKSASFNQYENSQNEHISQLIEYSNNSNNIIIPDHILDIEDMEDSTDNF